MTPEQRGIEAQQVLESPLVKDVLQAMKAEIIEQWADCPARDTEGREWMWRHYMIASKFEAILRGYAETGRFEARQLDQPGMISRIKRKLSA